MEPLTAALIGLGRVSSEDHLPALLESERVKLIAVCDTNLELAGKCQQQHGVPAYSSVSEMLSRCKPQVALIAVPHDKYLEIIKPLAALGIHILKEKPLACSLEEARQIAEIVRASKIKFQVNVPRRYNPLFRAFLQLRPKIGRVFSFDFRYTLNIADLSQGWRAKKSSAGGGCLLDMGYHAIDLVQWYFGRPTTVYASMSFKGRQGQNYDVEDTALLHLKYEMESQPIFGSIFVSRVFPSKEEKLTVLGTRGAIEVERRAIRRLNNKGDVVEEMHRSGEWPAAFLDQIEQFANWITTGERPPTSRFEDHFNHVAIIDAAYQSHEQKLAVAVADISKDQNGVMPNGD